MKINKKMIISGILGLIFGSAVSASIAYGFNTKISIYQFIFNIVIFYFIFYIVSILLEKILKYVYMHTLKSFIDNIKNDDTDPDMQE